MATNYSVTLNCDHCNEGLWEGTEPIFSSAGEKLILCGDCREKQFEADRQVETLVDSHDASECDARWLLIDQAKTTHGLIAALTAHYAECTACGCIRKTVVEDRLYLATKDSSCCGEAA